MESPDVVDTSDVDEREVFTLSHDVDHWASSALTPIKSVCADVLASPQSATTEKDYHRSSNGLLTRIICHDRFSNHEVENPSPRKRIKV